MPAATRTPATAPMTQRTRCKPETVARGGLSPVEGDPGHRAALVAVLERDVRPPPAHQVAGDREAEAGAVRAAPPGPPAVEALEHRLELLGVEPGTVVDDGDRARVDDETGVAPAVVQRVLDQDVQRAVEIGGSAAHGPPARDR